MVNMYSMGSMGMMNGYGMNNMGGSSVNVHQNFKSKYGVGYEDFGTRPYAQPYPMAIIPRRPEPSYENAFRRFLNKIFA